MKQVTAAVAASDVVPALPAIMEDDDPISGHVAPGPPPEDIIMFGGDKDVDEEGTAVLVGFESSLVQSGGPAIEDVVADLGIAGDDDVGPGTILMTGEVPFEDAVGTH